MNQLDVDGLDGAFADEPSVIVDPTLLSMVSIVDGVEGGAGRRAVAPAGSARTPEPPPLRLARVAPAPRPLATIAAATVAAFALGAMAMRAFGTWPAPPAATATAQVATARPAAAAPGTGGVRALPSTDELPAPQPLPAPAERPAAAAPDTSGALPASDAPRLSADELAALTVPVTLPVRFGFDSDQPVADTDTVVALARRCPGAIVVTGHACALGAARINRAVGFDRARAVKTLLTSHGVDAARIVVRSAGAQRPVASNANPAGRAENRRVTLYCGNPNQGGLK